MAFIPLTLNDGNNIDPVDWHQSSNLKDFDPSLTQQQFLDDCDINFMVSRLASTGLIDQVNDKQYLDLTDLSVNDYHSALNTINSANDKFDLLPSSIRNEFSNDPTNLLYFLADDTNRKKAETLGLVNAIITSVEQSTDTVTST
ncbi:MAG: internal scaffolding protein [Microvirus sp.]|nr:MAG: internal scaffolding protein [Microvirus sp.]